MSFCLRRSWGLICSPLGERSLPNKSTLVPVSGSGCTPQSNHGWQGQDRAAGHILYSVFCSWGLGNRDFPITCQPALPQQKQTSPRFIVELAQRDMAHSAQNRGGFCLKWRTARLWQTRDLFHTPSTNSTHLKPFNLHPAVLRCTNTQLVNHSLPFII